MPNIPNPSLALDVIDPWLYSGGRHSRRFQDAASWEDGYELLYDSYVGLAMLVNDIVGQSIGKASGWVTSATSFEEIRSVGVTRGISISVGKSEPGTPLGDRLIPFLNRVGSTIDTMAEIVGAEITPIPEAATADERIRTFDVISSFIESFINLHITASDLKTTAQALALYKAALASVDA